MAIATFLNVIGALTAGFCSPKAKGQLIRKVVIQQLAVIAQFHEPIVLCALN